MMQAADFWNLDHRTERGRLDRSADGRIFFERQMRAAPFVVFEIVLEDPAQTGLMENNDVIQAFAPNGPDQALRVSVLPWCIYGEKFCDTAKWMGIREVLTGPRSPSRSRSKYRGVLSQGKASKSCRAAHSAVGLEVTAK